MIKNHLNQEVISLEKSKYMFKTTYTTASKEVDLQGLELDSIDSYEVTKIALANENIEQNILEWDDKVCAIGDDYGIFNEFFDDICIIEGVDFGMVFEDTEGNLHICNDIEEIDEEFEFDYDEPIGVVFLKKV